jgi:hypothetical protein
VCGGRRFAEDALMIRERINGWGERERGVGVNDDNDDMVSLTHSASSSV